MRAGYGYPTDHTFALSSRRGKGKAGGKRKAAAMGSLLSEPIESPPSVVQPAPEPVKKTPTTRVPANPEKQRKFEEALAVLKAATETDTAGNYQVAFNQYQLGLEHVVPLLKEVSESDRARVQSFVVDCMNRAEVLKPYVKPPLTRSVSAPGGGVVGGGHGGNPTPGTNRQTPRGLPLKPGATPPGPVQTNTAAAELTELESEVLSEVLDNSKGVSWDAIAGLAFAKEQLQEAVVRPFLRPDLYTGLRAPPRGVLLFGPPGTGKTMLARAVARESNATFFSISASSLMSKWLGEGEKRVRALFSAAAKHQPAVIFIDEVDSMLSGRTDGENEASRRLKTEFMVQLDGANTNPDCHVFVLAATNRPWELDDAVQRRLSKRIYIPLPDPDTRKELIKKLMTGVKSKLSAGDMSRLVEATDGYSGSDLTELCREAARMGVRRLDQSALLRVSAADVDPVTLRDFEEAMRIIRPSVPPASLERYFKWNAEYGSSRK